VGVELDGESGEREGVLGQVDVRELVFGLRGLGFDERLVQGLGERLVLDRHLATHLETAAHAHVAGRAGFVHDGILGELDSRATCFGLDGGGGEGVGGLGSVLFEVDILVVMVVVGRTHPERSRKISVMRLIRYTWKV
jgi:hypothetical protein